MSKIGTVLFIMMALCLGTVPTHAQTAGPTVQAIQKRGFLLCTSNNGPNLGFMEIGKDGQWKGFDIDICRAIATAILGSPDKVKFDPISMAQRWPALRSGDVDLIVKTTDATMDRNTTLGFVFSIPYVYGADQVMVRREEGVKSVKELAGGTVCTSAGTDTPLFMTQYEQAHGFKVKILTFDTRQGEIEGYASKRCDGYLQWGPTLAAIRASLSNPGDNIILPQVLAAVPEVILMRRGDPLFVNVVNWTLEALFNAEEMGITKENVDKLRAHPTSPEMARLLGVTPGMGARLGLKDDSWAYKLIKALGNYREIWNRNLGNQSPYKLDPGMNTVWNHGGVIVPWIIH